MKKLAIFAAAFVLTLGLAQCKKEQQSAQTTDGETVHITVTVGNNGSRADIDGNHIVFNNGDKLYVGYHNACVGTLEYGSGAFSGSITIGTVYAEPLHFYYMGGGAAIQVGATQEYYVDISNQSTNYPVISYGTSTENYTGETGKNYTTTLFNKCGLVKFNLSTGTDAIVSIGGLYTKATIDFNNPGVVTPSTEGTITLHSGATNTEKWAILLPQTGVSATATISGYDCSVASFNVAINEYNTTGVSISMTPAVPVVTTVTWDNTNVFNSDHSGEVYDMTNPSGTFEGITITINANSYTSKFKPYDKLSQKGMLDVFGGSGHSCTFSAPAGKQFTKIEIIDNSYATFTAYGDWTKPTSTKAVWSGTASNTVTLGGSASSFFDDLNSIVFTME